MRLVWKIVLPLLIVALAVGISVVLIRNRPTPHRAPVVVTPPTIVIALVKPQDRRIDVRTHGTVQARATSVLGAEVSGRITWLREGLAEGVLVQAGDELLRIDDADYRAALTDAQATLALRRQELAQEQVEGARAEREWKELGDGQASDLVLRKPQLIAAQARILAAEAAVAKATRDLERTAVRAPYAARITRKVVDLGSRVAPGGDLLTLQAADTYEVLLPVTLDDLRFVDLPLNGEVLRDGPVVTLSVRIGERAVTWQGRIVRTIAGLDAKTRMVHAVASITASAAAPAIVSGLFVDAVISGRTVGAVVELPLPVLQTDDAVFVFRPGPDGSADGTVVKRAVEILERGEKSVLLRGDLRDGDAVVAVRISGIRDGMPARLDTKAAPEKAAPEKAAPEKAAPAKAATP